MTASERTNEAALSLYEQVFMLYGSQAWLEDLFTMQSHHRFTPSQQDFTDALITHQALLTLVTHGLATQSEDARHLRGLLIHSQDAQIREIAQRATHEEPLARNQY